MTKLESKDFVYWLQGYVELNGEVPNEKQWLIIKDHLAEVFDKKTPIRNEDNDEDEIFPIDDDVINLIMDCEQIKNTQKIIC